MRTINHMTYNTKAIIQSRIFVLFKRGHNTAEIARIMGLKEHRVDRLLSRSIDTIWDAKHAPVMRPEPASLKDPLGLP